MSEILQCHQWRLLDTESQFCAAPATLKVQDWLMHGYYGLTFVGLILCKGTNKLILSHFLLNRCTMWLWMWSNMVESFISAWLKLKYLYIFWHWHCHILSGLERCCWIKLCYTERWFLISQYDTIWFNSTTNYGLRNDLRVESAPLKLNITHYTLPRYCCIRPHYVS